MAQCAAIVRKVVQIVISTFNISCMIYNSSGIKFRIWVKIKGKEEEKKNDDNKNIIDVKIHLKSVVKNIIRLFYHFPWLNLFSFCLEQIKDWTSFLSHKEETQEIVQQDAPIFQNYWK